MEFGLIAPVLMIMILGTYDIGHEMYVKSVLNGALQEVGRNSALEGASNADQRDEIDDKLRETMRYVSPNANISITRRYYKTFSKAAAAQAESVIEASAIANGRCDAGESFMDANHNGIWDTDGGTDGQGGAKDVVIIKVEVSYQRLFPAAEFIGYGNNVILISDSVIANQPYGKQQQFAPPVAVNC
ncbi:MAG: TadE/TadG family type IV pilus assembly protein [Sphingorhabdus sp.]